MFECLSISSWFLLNMGNYIFISCAMFLMASKVLTMMCVLKLSTSVQSSASGYE